MVKRSRRLNGTVISVGNITWGGTGKTPIVIRLAQELAAHGCHPAVLTRGYFRKAAARGPVTVSDGEKIRAAVETAGDEPSLIARRARGAAVMVGPDRYSAGTQAQQEYGSDVFILDDGFQHWKLQRDVDIVCINAVNPFGNGHLIPAGILREPLNALRRATLVILTNSDSVAPEILDVIASRITAVTGKIPLRALYAARALRRVSDGTIVDIAHCGQQPVVALSALGENAGFRRTLENAGFQVKDHITFRDHHWYTQEELESISARAAGALLVTTEKDAMRLERIVSGTRVFSELYALEATIEFISGGDEWQQMVNSIKQSL
jgi:tetraacyldisaccharide 4'-kinase